MRNLYRGRSRLVILMMAMLCVTLLTSCKPKEPDWSEEYVLEPHVIRTYQSEDWVWAGDPSRAISPDGKWLLVSQYGMSKSILAVPLKAEEGQDAQGAQSGNSQVPTPVPMTAAAVEFKTEADRAQLLPVGWLSDSRCVFLVEGYHDQPPHKGQTGVSVLSGNVADGAVEEISFVPIPEGQLREASIFPSSNWLVLDAMGSIWTVDLGTGEARALRKLEVPDYSGLFTPKVSPEGTKCVYASDGIGSGQGESGLCLLDLKTGKETLLARNDDELHLYPEWSPDGKMVATYTVDRRSGTTGAAWSNFEIYPGDDAPMAWGTAIRVLDLSGSTVKEISVEDKILGLFKWAPDSKSLAFLAARKIPAPDIDGNWEVVMPSPDSVVISSVDPSERATTIADLGQQAANTSTGYLSSYVVGFDPESKGVFYETLNEEAWLIWYRAKGKTGIQSEPDKPVIVAEGPWHHTPSIPAFKEQGKSFVAFITGSGPKLSMYLAGPTAIRNVANWEGLTSVIVAYDEKTLVVSTFTDVYSLSVYEMHSPARRTP